MATTITVPEIMTPDQAAANLQVNRETIYRDIREGASKLGRTYRIPKRNLDLLWWANRTRPDIVLRDDTPDEIAEFLRRDQLDDATAAVARQIDNALTDSRS